MKLYAKVGTMPGEMVMAPKLRKLPWQGAVFEIRDGGRGSKLIKVRVTDIKRAGPSPCDPILHYLEKV